jgi:RNA polymerase sigma-70 factor (ECF subfamily)
MEQVAPVEESVEQYLVERAMRGDRNAFGELAPTLGDRLYSVAHRILRDRELAGDVTQQALVKVWQDLPTLRDAARFDAWSYRLIVNACYDELRRRRREGPSLTLLETDATLPDTQLTVADRDQLERGFRRLSAEHRAVVILTYYLDYSMPEVAEALGVPLGTVRSRLHYARRALRAALDADRRPALKEGRWA